MGVMIYNLLGYPIDDEYNKTLYNRYMSNMFADVIVGGRLGKYKYMNMDVVIADAMETFKKEMESK